MAKKRAESQQDGKAKKQSQQAKAVEEMAQQEELAGAEANFVGSADSPDIENVAARLGDERLPAAQRQKMAMQVGEVQGNRFLQRVVDVIQQERAEGWEMPLPPGGRLVSGDPTLQRAISTPLPKKAKKLKGGKAVLTVKGMRIMILPDRPAKKGEGVAAGGAETTFKFNWSLPKYGYNESDIVTSVRHKKASMVIQTLYGEGATAAGPAEYGRGTTDEDKAAGKTSLGYHEGSHGSDYLEFMKTKDYPQFKGKKGMEVWEFETAIDEYVQGWDKFQSDMDMFSKLRTDCVGDKHEQCVVWEKTETPEEGEGEASAEGTAAAGGETAPAAGGEAAPAAGGEAAPAAGGEAAPAAGGEAAPAAAGGEAAPAATEEQATE